MLPILILCAYSWLTKDIGVTPIPPSAFYTPAHKSFAENLGIWYVLISIKMN